MSRSCRICADAFHHADSGSTIIADCVSFILVDTLYLAGEIVNDGHKSHLQFTDFFDLIKDWSEIFPTLGAYLNFIM